MKTKIKEVKKGIFGFEVITEDGGQMQILSEYLLNGVEPIIGDELELVFLADAFAIGIEINKDGSDVSRGKIMKSCLLNGVVLFDRTDEEIISELSGDNHRMADGAVPLPVEELVLKQFKVDEASFCVVFQERIALLKSVGAKAVDILAEKCFMASLSNLYHAQKTGDMAKFAEVVKEVPNPAQVLRVLDIYQKDFTNLDCPSEEELANSEVFSHPYGMDLNNTITKEQLLDYLKSRTA